MDEIEKRLAAVESKLRQVTVDEGDRRILEGSQVFLENPDVETATRFLREIDAAIKPGDGGQVAATVTTVTVTVTITVKANTLSKRTGKR